MTEKQLELQPRRHQLSPDSVTGETIFGDISRPLRGQMENCLHTVRRDCWPECTSCRWLMEDLNAPDLWREGGGTLLKSCQANDRRQARQQQRVGAGGGGNFENVTNLFCRLSEMH